MFVRMCMCVYNLFFGIVATLEMYGAHATRTVRVRGGEVGAGGYGGAELGGMDDYGHTLFSIREKERKVMTTTGMAWQTGKHKRWGRSLSAMGE